MAVLGVLLTALALLGGSAAQRTTVSQHCIGVNSTYGGDANTIYQFVEKELNVPRSIRLSRFAGKVSHVTFNFANLYFNLETIF